MPAYLHDLPPAGDYDVEYLRADGSSIEPDADDELDDMPELDDDWFANATLVLPPPKKAISIRIDEDVLAWFKSLGPGYQTRMNALLRGYMEKWRKQEPEGR